MAVYTNLAIDCANNEDVACELVAIYREIRLQSVRFGTTNCTVEHIYPGCHWGQPDKRSESAGDWNTVCVSPNGVGNGLPLAQSLIEELMPQLYEPLKQGFKFRSAWFGWEAQDALGESDWLEILDGVSISGSNPNMPGLIVSCEVFKGAAVTKKLQPFCDGLVWYDPNAQE